MTTETLPAAVPMEPTTPIKPSEAIRLGCLLRPRATTGSEFEGEDGACVRGAMEAGGYNLAGLCLLGDRKCPADSKPDYHDGPLPMSWLVAHLNDGYCINADEYIANGYRGWSRERIADWLAEQGL